MDLQKTTYLTVPLLMSLAVMGTEMSTSLLTPALPPIQRFFHLTEGVSSLVISLNMIAFSAAGPLAGMISDSIGRRKCILVGLLIFLIGSALCIFPSFSTILAGRILQGIGTGFSVVLSMASIKDLFSGEQCAKEFSLLEMYVVVAPAFGPMVGGYITEKMGWHINFFLVLGVAIFLMVLLLLKFPETLPIANRRPFHLGRGIRSYLALLKSGPFLRNANLSGMSWAGIWVLIAALPYFLQDALGFTPFEYSLFFAIGPLSYMLGAWVNNRYVEKIGLERMLKIGIICSAGSYSLLFGFVFFEPMGDLLPLRVFTGIGAFATAFIFPNTGVKALAAHPQSAGAASALLTSIETAWAAVLASISLALYDGTLLWTAALMALCALTAAFIYIWDRSICCFKFGSPNLKQENRVKES